MDEIYKAELEADRGEVDRYRTSTPTTKAFAWFKKCCDAKKYCLVSFILLVLLLLQVTNLVLSTDFLQTGNSLANATAQLTQWLANRTKS